MSRKDDLEVGIRESYGMISECESTIRTSTDPQQRANMRRIAKEQWGHIERYWQEYHPLAGDDIPDDIAQVVAGLTTSSSSGLPSRTSSALPADQSRQATQASALRQTITWLHISDLHFRASQTYNSNIVLKALLQDIADCIEENALYLNLIILSGDIAFAGRPEEYKLAATFLNKLLQVTGLSREFLFLVPGNHDVDRNVISPFAASMPQILDNRDIVNQLLADEAERTPIFRRFHHYQDFVLQYFGQECCIFDDGHYFYVKRIEAFGQSVAILGLNSAWLSASDNDRNHLLLGERQVYEALEQTEEGDLRLAVMHHPFDWLQDSDRQSVESLLCSKCHFILHGHMHQVGLSQTRSPDSEAMLIAAGACYDTRQHPNSYNFVQLDLTEGRGTVYLRTYSDRQGGFWTRDVMNYRNLRDGSYVFTLPFRVGSMSSEIKGSAPGRVCEGPLARPHPFIYGRPLFPSEFLNREKNLRAIFNRLCNGESTAIVGEPHIGKTSMLCKLGNTEAQQAYLGSDRSHCLLTSFIDLHPIEIDYTPVAFWREALEPLTTNPDYRFLKDELALVLENSYDRRSLERLFTSLSRQGRRLVLLLDEFEQLLDHPNFQLQAFFGLLRSLATRTGGLALVTATRLSVAEMNTKSYHLLTVGSPFFNNMIDIVLGLLDENEVDKLLDQADPVFSEIDHLLIRRIAGRHPFLLQAIAAAMIESTGPDPERQICAVQDFYQRVAFHFDDLWSIMDNNTRTVAIVLSLVELAGRDLGQNFAFDELQHVNAFGPELHRLVRLGLAEQVEENWPFDRRNLFFCQGEQWTVSTRAFVWWVHDVAIARTRSVPVYDEWLMGKKYEPLLTQTQWDHLLSTVRNLCGWTLTGICELARRLVMDVE